MARFAASLASLALGSTLLVGCSGSDDNALPKVAVTFYPLEFAVSSMAGDSVELESITKPGEEPHDVDLSSAMVADLEDADLVIYLSGFQPAVDEAVRSLDPDKVLDVAEAADLVPFEKDNPEAEESETGLDPHFWLDPVRLGEVANEIAPRLSDISTEVKAEVATGLPRLATELETLDTAMESILSTCKRTTLVTSHSAFRYLADRYGLVQRGITGLNPEVEPSPGELADVAKFVEANGVETIYFETLVDPAIATTVADETGAGTAVLDPIEGLTDASEGDNYLEVMRSNLANLAAGQSCG